ncbi:SOCS box domain-containing protein [Trichonephila clavipes]|nr:SOCS box domain-containing protein [Trichonephila clavipes]
MFRFKLPKCFSFKPVKPERKLRARRRLDDGYLPFFSNSQDIEFKQVNLNSAADEVRYSFIVHKSVTCLDLSVGEYRNREKLCYTMCAYKNKILSRRYILYKYHLDVTDSLDDNVSKFNKSLYKICSHDECFYLNEVSIVDKSVYNIEFMSYVKEAIQKSNHKIRSVMKFIKFLNVQKGDLITVYYDFLELMAEEREDSELVYKFLQIEPLFLNELFFYNYKPHLVDFVLYHATRLKRRLLDEVRIDWRPSLFIGSLECLSLLIKYGYNYPFFREQYLLCFKGAIEYYIQEHRDSDVNLAGNCFSSKRRRYLFLHTVFFLLCNDSTQSTEPKELVYLFWESIPDALFTRNELNYACDKHHFMEPERSILIQNYESKVSSPKSTETPIPRSLVHLCRCSIRERMGSNFELPFGVDSLLIPEDFKKYLRLEIPYESEST